MSPEPARPTHTNILTKPISGKGPLLLLAVLLVLLFGNYHIVSDSGSLLVKRPYFGFSDIFASAKVCTSGPWIIAKAQHPSLCLALQNAGLIESDAAFQSRVKSENAAEFQKHQECTSKCDYRRSDYAACISAC